MSATSGSLPTAPLGGTGMDITRVGFGAWAVGGGGWKHGWGTQDDLASEATIRQALDEGINWIDTAPVYGLGRSEEVVGRVLRSVPEADRPYVFTKCGLTFDPADPDDGPYNVMAADSLRQQVEDSLRRLQVERIDLYQVHWPPTDGTALEEYWATMLELKREGKIRGVGLSNHDVKQLEAADAVGHVDSLQPPFSMIDRDAGADLIPWCAEHGTGVLVYSPMQSGLLTGAMSAERVAALPEDDWRRRSPDFADPALTANLALAAALAPVAARHGVAVGAVAVAWTLAWPGVTAAIVGARRPDQVLGWLPAATLTLPAADVAELTAAIESTGAGHGPVAAARAA
ncbi:MAG TPA: aldo/keto reductase [Sporichthya sp.]|nr:aldo/keto reductase [Sporichthya sp.]